MQSKGRTTSTRGEGVRASRGRRTTTATERGGGGDRRGGGGAEGWGGGGGGAGGPHGEQGVVGQARAEHRSSGSEREPRILVDLKREVPEEHRREHRGAHDEPRLLREAALDEPQR